MYSNSGLNKSVFILCLAIHIVDPIVSGRRIFLATGKFSQWCVCGTNILHLLRHHSTRRIISDIRWCGSHTAGYCGARIRRRHDSAYQEAPPGTLLRHSRGNICRLCAPHICSLPVLPHDPPTQENYFLDSGWWGCGSRIRRRGTHLAALSSYTAEEKNISEIHRRFKFAPQKK